MTGRSMSWRRSGRPEPSARAQELLDSLVEFMEERVFPAERSYREYRLRAGPDDHVVPPVMHELKAEARRRGLWNLFLPAESGLTQLEYARFAEVSGWSLDLAPEAMNCAAPDTGNMELLHLVGNGAQQEQWLRPLLDGQIRSAYAMTEPEVASSDATNIETRIEADGDDFIVNGRKWWISGAADPRCALLIVMGQTDPGAARHARHSMVLVPADTPGVTVVRSLPVFGRQDQHGHCEILFEDVRIPQTNLLGERGGGFAAAQKRLGPGRIHHCMRAIGAAERALQLMISRAKERTAFGGPLAQQGVVRQHIAESRVAIEQAREICHFAAHQIDSHGNQAASAAVAMAKLVVPRAAADVIDRAIQVHGGAGVSDDIELAAMWGWHRAMRIFDGPDDAHLRTIARAELDREPVFALPLSERPPSGQEPVPGGIRRVRQACRTLRNWGARFARNALTPSLYSSLRTDAEQIAAASTGGASGPPASDAIRISAFAPSIETRASSLTRCARPYAARSSAPGGRTSCTMPRSAARAAPNCSPVNRIQRAHAGPTISTRRRVDGRLYTRPSFAGVMANRAVVSHSRRSHAKATSAPPPTAYPSIIAIVGRGKPMMASPPRSTALLYRLAPSTSARRVANSEMSAPAENGPPGVPRTTTASTLASSASAGKIRPKASHISKVIALRRSGRVNWTVATRSLTLTASWPRAAPSSSSA
jgi:acyl-CoA dehydrogenase